MQANVINTTGIQMQLLDLLPIMIFTSGWPMFARFLEGFLSLKISIFSFFSQSALYLQFCSKITNSILIELSQQRITE